MSEKDLKLFAQLSALQYMVQRLYLIMYAKEGISLSSAKELHARLIEHTNSTTFPSLDAGGSMLAAGELGDALAYVTSGIEEMMAASAHTKKE